MTNRGKRIAFFLMSSFTFLAAVLLILFSLQKHMIYFYYPSEITAELRFSHKVVRIGGLVVAGSYSKGVFESVPEHRFTITDKIDSLQVIYRGITPELFREGQGVIVQGVFSNSNVFTAKTLLVKHDENYRPPEIKKLDSKEPTHSMKVS